MDNSTSSATASNMLSDKAYSFIKNLVQLILPGFSTLYLTLAGTWDLPNANKVVATTAALATFLGVVLKLSKKSYDANEANFDGKIVVSTNEEGVKVYSLELAGDPETIDQKNSVSFKVG